MNAWQPFSHIPWVSRRKLDPYRFPGARGLPDPGEQPGRDQLPGSGRPPGGPGPEERRRRELYACLNEAGIRPRAADLRAIEVLSSVDDVTHAAIRRWISSGTS
ncbi:hypothetical protein [Streptomyces sp. SPB4]|uniref:hypothetical protein n=1 Tax=Streptomyces sp. SPB4 TaxID=2940553 RepID=UPI0024740F68|nr:hypothetical protein [Streptomyces sp. SPB4]MDH6543930.1 hypothetical protein [Streptomyces sp. SPB4]